VGPRCSFCGTEAGPYLDVEGGLRLLMCARCQVARGLAVELLAAYDPGQPYLQWSCALCPYQVFWPRDLEGHTAHQHPGWTAVFEILTPYPHQRLRVVYRGSDGLGSALDRRRTAAVPGRAQGPGQGGAQAPG
jgi:hypothetical protein